MPRNGSGTFNLVAGNPVTTGSLIQSTWGNNTLSDIASALTGSLSRDGQAAMTGPLPMGGQDIQNAANLTVTGNATTGRLTLTDATMPVNGLYLPSANTVGLATASTQRGTVNGTGNWSLIAPSSGATLTLASVSSTGIALALTGYRTSVMSGTSLSELMDGSGAYIDTSGAAPGYRIYVNGALSTTWGANRNIALAAPSSGITLTINAVSLGTFVQLSDGTRTGSITTSAGAIQFGTSSAHGVDIYTSGSTKIGISTAGNVTVFAPGSGIPLTLNAPAATNTAALYSTGSTTGALYHQIANTSGNTVVGAESSVGGALLSGTAAYAGVIYSNGEMNIGAGSATRIKIASAGNITVTAPTSGTTLALASVSSTGLALAITGYRTSTMSGTTLTETVDGSGFYSDYSGSAPGYRLYVGGSLSTQWSSSRNVTISAAASGITVTVNGVSGTHSMKIADSATNLFNTGYLELPINSQAGNYTAVLSDSSKAIYYTGGAGNTLTIPANGSVAYPTGTTLTFANDGSASVSIAITTDTLVLSPSGSTGTRTLAQYGRATAHKVTSTRWIISGTGLS